MTQTTTRSSRAIAGLSSRTRSVRLFLLHFTVTSSLALANAFSLDIDLSEADLIPSRRPQHPACALPPVDIETPPSAFSRLFNSARSALMASSNAAAAQVTRQTFPGVKHGEQPSLEDVAGLIKVGKAKRIIVMVSEVVWLCRGRS